MKAFNLFILTGATVIFLTSCTYEHVGEFSKKWAGRAYLTDHYQIERSARERLAADSRIYLPFTLGQEGIKADVDQAEYLCGVFSGSFPATRCGLRPETLDQAFISARSAGADYLLWSSVSEWADGENTFRLKRDAIQVKVRLYRVSSAALYDNITLTARDGVFANSRRTPVDLLKYAYLDLVDVLAQDRVL